MKRFDFISNVLEVGCGTGEVLDLISKKGYNIKGIDLSSEAVSICKQKCLNAEKADLLDLKERFNSLICIDVLEHIENDHAAVDHLREILNEKGKLFIMVPSGRMMPDDTACGHYRRYTKDSIVRLLERSNFRIKHVEMMGYPIIYYTRILMNCLCSKKIDASMDIKTRTMRSSYCNPFDDTACARFYAKISQSLFIAKILLGILLAQDLFKNGNTGWAVIVVAEK